MNNLIKSILTMLLFTIGASHSFAEKNQKVTFYHYDLLGSPVATTDETGKVTWREEYSPWGEKLLKEDEAHDNVRGYTGHVNDKETGLTYMQARYYDPQIGRFMGVDPIGFKESSPISFNRYGYANNNPFKFVDPNGEAPRKYGAMQFMNSPIAAGAGGNYINRGSYATYISKVRNKSTNTSRGTIKPSPKSTSSKKTSGIKNIALSARELKNARQRGVNRAKSAERSLVKSGHPGTADNGGWSLAERKMIAEKNQFPSDTRWHHINSAKQNPHLASVANNVIPSRGGTAGHVKKYHPEGTQKGSSGKTIDREKSQSDHLDGNTDVPY